MTEQNSKINGPVLLVIGDWLIDEYWFLVRHYCDKSSHTGPAHYRIINSANDIVYDLCGAGHVVRVAREIMDGHRTQTESSEKNTQREEVQGNQNTSNGQQTSEKRNSHEDRMTILGAGFWHEEDDRIICQLLHPRCGKDGIFNKYALAKFKLTWDANSTPPDGVQVIRMGRDDNISTIVVVREYYQIGKGFKQLSRVDWERKRRPNYKEKIIDDLISDIEARVSDWTNIQGVVLLDLAKGTITPELIAKLRDTMDKGGPNDNEAGATSEESSTKQGSCSGGHRVPWFVRSKTKRPEWLSEIQEDLAILLIAPEVAARHNPWGSWLAPNGQPSHIAFKTVDELPGPHAILLSEQREVTARLNRNFGTSGQTGKGELCVATACKTEPNQMNQLGWASAFFASIINQYFQQQEVGSSQTAKSKNDTKIKIRHLTKENIEISVQQADIYSGLEPPKDIKLGVKHQRQCTDMWHGSWDQERSRWEYSVKGKGKYLESSMGIIVDPSAIDAIDAVDGESLEKIINQESPSQLDFDAFKEARNITKQSLLTLEVWRGSTLLPGYVTCIEEKKNIILDLGKAIRAFAKDEGPSRALSILILADPGAGKTYLARQLARAFDFDFLQFDITQMIGREEIIELFDIVANRQANRDMRKVLVFVDEINATLDGGHVFSSFLAPLEDGVYLRRGRRFGLEPCIWVFAGTRSKSDELKRSEKYSDFESRITMKRYLDYESLRDKYDLKEQLLLEARLEQVYLGASLIRDHFPDVNRVSWALLKHFYELDPRRSPARRIRRAAAALKNVQYGNVSCKNCPVLQDHPMAKMPMDELFIELVF